MRVKAVTTVACGCILAVVSVALSRPARATDTPRRIEIVAKRFTYTPEEITIKKGEPVVLALQSGDFLFIPVNGSWDTKYGFDGAAEGNNTDGDNFKAQGENILGPGAGTYLITVDFKTGKWKMTKQ